MAEVLELVVQPKSIVEINNTLPYIKSITNEIIDLHREIEEWAGEFITSCQGSNQDEIEKKLDAAFKSNEVMSNKIMQL